MILALVLALVLVWAITFYFLLKVLNAGRETEAELRQVKRDFMQAIDVLFDVQSPKQVPWQDIEAFVTKIAGERNIVIKNSLLDKLLELLGKKP